MKTLLHALACCLVLGSLVSSSFAETKKPNIIVIMADDLGYGDVGCYGAKAIPTPNIDALASDGLRFTSGYCSTSTCTPTRFAFLTGMYAFRQQGTGIAPPNATSIIKPSTETFPEVLQKAGYKTAVVGKWHLGLGEGKGPDWNGELKPGPLEIGFDYCFLLPTTNDRVPSVYVENHRVRDLDPNDPLWVGNTNPDGQPTGVTARDTLKLDWSHGHNNTIHNGIGRIGFFTGGHAARWRDEDLADEWVKKSNEWITANKDEPFFLFFASHDTHVPRMPHERFQGKTSVGLRGDAIVQLDWCVGEIVKTLDKLNLTDNTLIVFCSDNGPVLDDGYKDGAVEKLGDHLPAGPYRGGKYTPFEGGTRTPFIVKWPTVVKPGQTSDKLITTTDLGATFASIVGQELPAGALPDSEVLTETLLGEADAKGRDYVVEEAPRGIGLRVGEWKLVRQGRNKNTTISLFNLANDPGETTDISQEHPAKLKELETLLAKIEAKK
ncbi:sulfatase family protein [Blastopirellula marina]|uniref:Arylsulfatase n=1 Tax=Blastopirellula marina TaxID=124 RepID=A0A2S8F4B8_9BACT|nr:arylsulfatase [Blastopirellula marina]PQO26993.1 arylsulfatase [Blastopirellula marina]PTL41140.1 arylsulfatase [Blastopirellula marina]